MVATRQTRRRLLRTAGLAVGSSIVMGTASAEHEETWTFHADLTGEAETEDVETNATGRATFEIPPDDHRIHYRIDVEWLCYVTQAHIHLGEEGEDGPVVAWLYPEEGQEPQLIEGRFDGTLAEGTFTIDDLVGPLEDTSEGEIVSAMIDGNGYVNLHTEEYPVGEIRGQICPDDATQEMATEAAEDDEDEVVTDAADAELSLGAINVADKDDDEFAGLFVTLANDGDTAIDFTGWTMQDQRDDGVVDSPGGPSAFRFPDGFTLEAGAHVRIYTGGDESQNSDGFNFPDSDESQNDRTLHWGLSTQVWDETGDTVIVKDTEGDVALEESYDNGDQAAAMRRFVSRISSQLI